MIACSFRGEGNRIARSLGQEGNRIDRRYQGKGMDSSSEGRNVKEIFAS